MSTANSLKATAPIAATWFDAWKTRQEEKRRRRALLATRRQLRELSDDILRDIGLTRGDIGGFDPSDVTRRPR